MTRRILVFGATSYLGNYVLKAVQEQGDEVVAVVREPAGAAILLPRDVRTVGVDDVRRHVGNADVVINLAYVKTEVPHRLLSATRALNERVLRTTREVGAQRLLHTSTMAVFGYSWAVAPKAEKAPVILADSYAQAKRLSEVQFLAAEQQVAIVRLGNILGPGSPTWTAAIAQRLLEGKPVGLHGVDGLSNACWAADVGRYLAVLASLPQDELDRFGSYHHLASLARTPWRFFTDAMAAAIGVEPRFVDGVNDRQGGGDLLIRAMRDLYMGAAGGAGRAVAGRLPEAAKRPLDRVWDRLVALKRPSLALDEADEADRLFLEVMSQRTPFVNHNHAAFQNWVGVVEAREAVVQWVVEAGYAG